MSYVLGYTGLGVGATRFGAQVMLDHLGGRRTERTELAMVRKKPIPFPPEPIKSAGIQLTRWSIGRADSTRGSGTSGSGAWTGSVSASTPEAYTL